jgi:hypothetical protein
MTILDRIDDILQPAHGEVAGETSGPRSKYSTTPVQGMGKLITVKPIKGGN